MKIAIIGPAYPLRGGIADFNEALTQSLLKAGHECEVFSFKLQYPTLLFPGKTQYKVNAAPPPFTIHETINSIGPLSWTQTAQKIKRFHPDLILVRFWIPFMGMALGRICKSLKKDFPIIAITDNVIPHESKPGDRRLTRFFLKQCHGYITMSDAVAKDLQDIYPNDRTKVTPHPIYNIYGDKIPQEEARKKLHWDDTPTLLFFGLVRKYKGLDLLLDALHLVQNKDWKLCIAGEFYDDPQKYHQKIAAYQLQDNIIMDDHFIDDEDIKYYFSAADIMVQPYRTATQSGVAQIAYHFETPMLVTDVGGLAEIVPDGKVGKVSTPDARDLAAKIDALLDNRSVLEEYRKNIPEYRKKYEWPYFIENILALYQQIGKS